MSVIIDSHFSFHYFSTHTASVLLLFWIGFLNITQTFSDLNCKGNWTMMLSVSIRRNDKNCHSKGCTISGDSLPELQNFCGILNTKLLKQTDWHNHNLDHILSKLLLMCFMLSIPFRWGWVVEFIVTPMVMLRKPKTHGHRDRITFGKGVNVNLVHWWNF